MSKTDKALDERINGLMLSTLLAQANYNQILTVNVEKQLD